MARHIAWALAALLLVPVAGGAAQPTPQAQQAGQAKREGPPKWWVDDKSRAELGITDAAMLHACAAGARIRQ